MEALTGDLIAVGIPFELRVVPVARLHPNPWNPNRMDAATLQAERESIAAFGFVDPVTCRLHPDREGHLQIIDGEHRWRIATAEGRREVPAVVLDLDDIAAKRLTMILNETRGRPDQVSLSRLLRGLRTELGDRLGEALRYSPRELDQLLSLSEPAADWKAGDLDAEPPSEADADEFVLAARLPEGFRPNIEKAAAALGEGRPAPIAEVVLRTVEAFVVRTRSS